jgi:hypothetical protein
LKQAELEEHVINQVRLAKEPFALLGSQHLTNPAQSSGREKYDHLDYRKATIFPR